MIFFLQKFLNSVFSFKLFNKCHINKNLFKLLNALAMPMGQMPILEVDGIRVHQSSAINRYIAKRVGLAGSNDWESLQIDIVADTFTDFRLSECLLFLQ